LPKSQIQDENNQVIDDQDLKTRKSYLVKRLETGFNLPMLANPSSNLPPQILPKSSIQDQNNQVTAEQDRKTRKSYLKR
jgi:hypothetical protein